MIRPFRTEIKFKKSSTVINPQNEAVNNTMCCTVWHFLAGQRQLQLSTRIYFKKCMQIGHLVFELCAVMHFATWMTLKLTLKVKNFVDILSSKIALVKMCRPKKEIVRIGPCLFELCAFLCLFKYMTLNLTSKVKEFRGHLFSKTAWCRRIKQSQKSSKSDFPPLNYLQSQIVTDRYTDFLITIHAKRRLASFSDVLQ